MIVFNGIKLAFGAVGVPKLPEGFTIKRQSGQFVEAWKDGKRFLIALEPSRLVPIIERENDNGKLLADFKNSIAF